MKNITDIQKYFQQDSNILLAYLFGSQVTGKIGPMSDYDIGVYFEKSINLSQKYFLEVDLRKIIPTNALDLVNMNEAPLVLNYNIICGKCIYAVDETTRVEFEATIMSRYFDYLPVLKEQRNEILSTVKNEQQIQRNRIALGKTEKLLAEIGAI